MNYYSDVIKTLTRNCNLRAIPDDSTDSSLIDLSTNDYLGINCNAALKRSFLESTSALPDFSSTASRLLAASQREYAALENLFAELYGRYVLLFNSGYHANVGLVSALAAGKTLIVADKLVHASIIDGMVLSRATFMRFQHNDVSHLRQILAKHAADYERVLIICESVYSMDGDIAPIKEIAESKTPNSILYVDEAHAFGVMGRNGLGLCVDIPEVDIIVGTLGKAIASMGAFVAVNNRDLLTYIINSARSFIFSTALPPVNCAWSRYVIEYVVEHEELRTHLRRLNLRLGQILGIQSPTHIQPLIVGSSEGALTLSNKLRENGYKVLPIRTPTVPVGTERLRFSLSANLNEEQLSGLESILHT